MLKKLGCCCFSSLQIKKKDEIIRVVDFPERKREHERQMGKNLTININYKHFSMKFSLMNNFKL